MPTNFYYFKFIATEWLTGDISLESLQVQGLFINICALYWHKSGKLTLDEIKNRYKNPPELDKLVGKYILSKKTGIAIKFLNKQLLDTNRISKVNKVNGLKGGRPKKQINQRETDSVSIKKQCRSSSIVELEEEVVVETTTTGLDEISELMVKCRPEIPQKTILQERQKFELTYPGRTLPKHSKLVIEWAERIKYVPHGTSAKEFDLIVQKNKETYGDY